MPLCINRWLDFYLSKRQRKILVEMLLQKKIAYTYSHLTKPIWVAKLILQHGLPRCLSKNLMIQEKKRPIPSQKYNRDVQMNFIFRL